MQTEHETTPARAPLSPDASSAARKNDEDIQRLRAKYKRQRFERNKRRHQHKQIAALCVLLLLIAALIFGVRFLCIQLFGGSAEASGAAESDAQETASADPSPASETPTQESAEADAASAEPEVLATASLMAVGDNLMHNTVMECGHMNDGSYSFNHLYEAMAEDIAAADIACINQETIYIDDPSEYTNYPAFGGPTAIGEALAELGFDVVTHATNHAYDKLETGISDTLAFWRTHPEVTCLGIHDSAEDAQTIRVVEANGIRIAMLNYTYGLNYSYPSEDYWVDLLGDKDKISDDIQRAKAQSDIVIVFMHVGTEYTYTPDADQLEWAQFFADEGVGAVIGGHPHVVQPMDVLTGKDGNEMPVFYSLGNFISHQDQAPRLLGAMANMTIVKDTSGTYVTDCTMTPLVTLITRGSDHGAYGLGFSVMKLSDYTDEMAASHIISGTTPAEFQSLWDSIMNP